MIVVAPVRRIHQFRLMQAAEVAVAEPSVAERHGASGADRSSIGPHSVPDVRHCDADPDDADVAQGS